MAAPDRRASDPHVAVIGAGAEGSAVACHLASSLQTTVWDPSRPAAAALAEAGAMIAASPAHAAGDARVVITMLPTAEAVRSVIFDAGVTRAFAAGAVWVQMGMIGGVPTTEIADRLGQLRPDVLFVDAPVSGSQGFADRGPLLILAAGPPAAEPVLRPVFSAIGCRAVWWARPAGRRTRCATPSATG